MLRALLLVTQARLCMNSRTMRKSDPESLRGENRLSAAEGTLHQAAS
jgi:hypothetical protein